MSLPDASKIPLVPIKPVGSPNGLWRLICKKGSYPSGDVVFFLNDALQKAIERAQLHCTRMHYKYIRVEPFCISLDEMEHSTEEREARWKEEHAS